MGSYDVTINNDRESYLNRTFSSWGQASTYAAELDTTKMVADHGILELAIWSDGKRLLFVDYEEK